MIRANCLHVQLKLYLRVFKLYYMYIPSEYEKKERYSFSCSVFVDVLLNCSYTCFIQCVAYCVAGSFL
jgi:hypothetical protein